MEAPRFVVGRIQSVSTTSIIERYIFNSGDKGVGEERDSFAIETSIVRRKYETKIRSIEYKMCRILTRLSKFY